MERQISQREFLKRVNTTVTIEMVDPWIINRSIEGINRRISRERNHIYRCEELEVVLSKLETIEKLKAIKKQLKLFKLALVYSTYRSNILEGKLSKL